MADGMAGRFVGGAIALVLGVALIPVLADFVSTAQGSSAVTATQETVIGLVLTTLPLRTAYAAYPSLVA